MYRLKTADIDLTRHVRTQAGVKRYNLKIGSPIGKHPPASTQAEATSLNVGGVTFSEHVKRLDTLMQRVQSNEDSETVDENAWAEVATRLEAMQKIATQKGREMATERKRSAKVTENAGAAATGAAVGAMLLKAHMPQKVVEIGKEWAGESMTHSLALMGVNFATSAASLIGAQQSEHFAAAFEHIIENPAVEVGFTTATALLISALIARIRKALRDRKDRKIARARGEVLSGNTTLPTG